MGRAFPEFSGCSEHSEESNCARLLLVGLGHRPLGPEGVAALIIEPPTGHAGSPTIFR